MKKDNAFEDEFNLVIDDEDVEGMRNVDDLINYVNDKLG